MRHLKKKKILGRKTGPRKLLFKNLAVSLIIHEKIKTTLAKAKVLRRVVEKLITRGKIDSLANRRYVLSFLHNEGATRKIFDVLGPRYKTQPGGYTRITRLSRREGDRAEIVIIELVK